MLPHMCECLQKVATTTTTLTWSSGTRMVTSGAGPSATGSWTSLGGLNMSTAVARETSSPWYQTHVEIPVGGSPHDVLPPGHMYRESSSSDITQMLTIQWENLPHPGTRPILKIQLGDNLMMICLQVIFTKNPHPSDTRQIQTIQWWNLPHTVTRPILTVQLEDHLMMFCLQAICTKNPHHTDTRIILTIP